MKIVICGSMVFAAQMLAIGKRLAVASHQVVTPVNVEKHARDIINIENRQEKKELDVIRAYFGEIKNSDAILVVNKDKNNIKNYVGGNSLIEMVFAYVLQKKIFLLNPIPKIAYADEIEVMEPIILYNDLSKIK